MDTKIQQAMDEALESVERRQTQHSIDVIEELPPEGDAQVSPGEDGVLEPVEQTSADNLSEEFKQKAEQLEDDNRRLKEQLMRLGADFENYRKRVTREQEELNRFGAGKLVGDLLPVIDNLERALQHAPEHAQEHYESLRQGLQMVHQQFLDALKHHHVEAFEAKGEAFDPNVHEAISQAPSEEVPAGHIVDELQRGYMHHNRLLRPSLVVVAMAPPKPKATEDAPAEQPAEDTAPQDEAAPASSDDTMQENE